MKKLIKEYSGIIFRYFLFCFGNLAAKLYLESEKKYSSYRMHFYKKDAILFKSKD